MSLDIKNAPLFLRLLLTKPKQYPELVEVSKEMNALNPQIADASCTARQCAIALAGAETAHSFLTQRYVTLQNQQIDLLINAWKELFGEKGE